MSFTPLDEEVPKKGCFRKCLQFLRDNSIQPFLFIVMFSVALKIITYQNLLQERVCLLEQHRPEEICLSLEIHEEDKVNVQKVSGYLFQWSTIISMLPSAFMSILLGPWSDLYGRRIVMIAALFGMLLENIILIFFIAIPSFKAEYSLIGSVPNGIFGGLMIILTASYSSVTDSSDSKTRANKFASLEFAFIVAMPLGMLSGGLLFKAGRYILVYSFSIMCLIIAFIWAIFIIQESVKNPKKAKVLVMMKDFIATENFKKCVKTFCKKRKGNLRLQVLLLSICLSTFLIIQMGEGLISFPYVQRVFNWDNPTYSIYAAVLHLTQGIIFVLATRLNTKKLQLHDGIVGLIGTLSIVVQSVIKGLATKQWVYILAYVVGSLTSMATISSRARVSKIIDKDEVGRIFTVVALIESAVPTFTNMLFNFIYVKTLRDFPGAVYLFGSFVFILPGIIYTWILFQPIKFDSPDEEKEMDTIDNVALN